jgi:hypothetical protein
VNPSNTTRTCDELVASRLVSRGGAQKRPQRRVCASRQRGPVRDGLDVRTPTSTTSLRALSPHDQDPLSRGHSSATAVPTVREARLGRPKTLPADASITQLRSAMSNDHVPMVLLIEGGTVLGADAHGSPFVGHRGAGLALVDTWGPHGVTRRADVAGAGPTDRPGDPALGRGRCRRDAARHAVPQAGRNRILLRC